MIKKRSFAEQLEALTGRATTDRLRMLEQIVAYGETDLLCYRADQPKMAALHAKHFDPVLKAVKDRFGIGFILTDSLMPVAQSTESLNQLHALFAEASDRELAALFALTPLLGSALLALALWKKLIPLTQAIDCAVIDEVAAALQWGEDPQEKALRDARIKDIASCAIFLDS